MRREYRWTVADTLDNSAAAQLGKEINVSESIAKILIRRGISTYDSAKEFFRPELKSLHDPALMDGMDKAVERILRAVEAKERVLVFGDYDVDGTNSAAMLYVFFTKLGLETIYHIPDRIKEGYGISN